MGNKKSIEKVKDLFFSDRSHEEVPEAKSLAPYPDRILEAVAKLYRDKGIRLRVEELIRILNNSQTQI